MSWGVCGEAMGFYAWDDMTPYDIVRRHGVPSELVSREVAALVRLNARLQGLTPAAKLREGTWLELTPTLVEAYERMQDEQSAAKGHIRQGRSVGDRRYELEFHDATAVEGTLAELDADIDGDLVARMKSGRGDWVVFPRVLRALLYDPTTKKFVAFFLDRTDGHGETLDSDKDLRQCERRAGEYSAWILDAAKHPGEMRTVTGQRQGADGTRLRDYRIAGAPDVPSQSRTECMRSALECLAPHTLTDSLCQAALSTLYGVTSATSALVAPMVDTCRAHRSWLGFQLEEPSVSIGDHDEAVTHMLSAVDSRFVVWVDGGTHCVAVDTGKRWLMETAEGAAYAKPFRLCRGVFGSTALDYEIHAIRELVVYTPESDYEDAKEDAPSEEKNGAEDNQDAPAEDNQDAPAEDNQDAPAEDNQDAPAAWPSDPYDYGTPADAYLAAEMPSDTYLWSVATTCIPGSPDAFLSAYEAALGSPDAFVSTYEAPPPAYSPMSTSAYSPTSPPTTPAYDPPTP